MSRAKVPPIMWVILLVGVGLFLFFPAHVFLTLLSMIAVLGLILPTTRWLGLFFAASAIAWYGHSIGDERPYVTSLGYFAMFAFAMTFITTRKRSSSHRKSSVN